VAIGSYFPPIIHSQTITNVPTILVHLSKIIKNLSPTPLLQGEGLLDSPFPCREGGWGVRFLICAPVSGIHPKGLFFRPSLKN